jgi:formate hydrogenlyase subunit 6/NADH:ubiquinone oxidoreductase subunit I
MLNLELPVVAIWVVGGLALLYGFFYLWLNLSIGRLFWQNVFRLNQVALPKFGKNVAVPATGSEATQSQALVMLDEDTRDMTPGERGGIIYPAQGRNGLNFSPARCISCGLCQYVCPTNTISTTDKPEGYTRQFDLNKCFFCGLCEAACSPNAIRLTVNLHAWAKEPAKNVIGGVVERSACPTCGRKAPQADLLAERVYNLAIEDETVKKRKLAFVQKEASCPACLAEVLAAEEKI